MDQIIQMLIQADQHLDKVAVKGEDAFIMVRARGLMKQAFELLLQKQQQKEGGKEVGSER